MGEFGTEDLMGLGTGTVRNNTGLYKLSSTVETLLNVLVYNASGDFVQSFTTNQTNGVGDASDPNYVQYWQEYSDLKIADVRKTSGIQINLQELLNSIRLPQGVYRIVTNQIAMIDSGAYIKQIAQDRTEIRFGGIPASSDNTDINFGENALPEVLGNHKLDVGMGRSVSLINWTIEGGDLIAKLGSPAPMDTFQGGTYPLYMDITDPTIALVQWEVASDSIQYPFLHPNFDMKVRGGTPINTEFKTIDDLTGTVKSTKDKIINNYLSSSYGDTEVNINYQKPEEFIHFSSYEERLLNFKYKIQLIEKYATEISASDTLTGALPTVVADRANIVEKQDNVIGSFDKFEEYMYNNSSSAISGSLGEWWSNSWPKNTSIAPHKIYATTSSEAQTWLTGAIQSASYYDRMNDDMLSKALPEYVLEDINNSTIITLTDMIGQHYDVVWTYTKGLTDVTSRDEELTSGIAKNLLWHVGTSLGIDLPNGNGSEDLWKWSLGTDVSGSLASSGTGFESGSLPQMSSEDVTKSIWSRLINNLPYFLSTKGTTRGLKAVLACYGVPDTIIQVREYGGPKGINDNERQFMQEERATYALQLDRGETLRLKVAKNSTHSRTPQAFQFRFKTTQKEDMVLLEKNGTTWCVNIHHSGSITQTSDTNFSSNNIPLIAQTPRTEKGIYGRLTFLMTGSSIPDHAASVISASTEYLPLYNGDWWNVTLQTEVTASLNGTSDNTTTDQRWHLTVKSAKDHSNGKITHSGSATLNNHTGSYSASFNAAWRTFGTTNYWSFGGWAALSQATKYDSTGVATTAGTVKQFSGSMQEIRIWGGEEKLTEDVLEVHTLSPRSYVGNNFSSSYDHLYARFPLGTEFQKSNLSGSLGTYTSPTIISSSHPNQDLDWTGGTYALHLTASAFSDATTGSNGTHFEPMTETYYTTLPSYPSNGISSTKLRVEEAGLTKQLNPFERAEVSEYDRHPIDTHNIGVHLSLQHQINRDIAYQFGGMRVDDFIGDPKHQSDPGYPDLEQLSNFYFNKLYDKPDMADFARMLTYYDVSMFQMVKKMIPARANSYVGLLVEPHILERNKIQRLPEMTQSAHHYDGVLDVRPDINTFPLSMSADYQSEYSASLLCAGGENWFELKADSANSASFGDLSDGIAIGHLTGSYNGSRYRWSQHYRNKNADGTYTVGSYTHTSNPFNTVITGSRLSSIWETRVFKYSSSFSASWDSDRGIMQGTLGYGLSETKAAVWNVDKGSVKNGAFDRQRGKAHIYPVIGDVPTTPAERQDTEPAGFFNARYGGSKLSAGGYNQDSPQTADGTPVIELFDSNPNQLIVTSPSVYGGSLTVPGIKKFPGKGQALDKFGNVVSLLKADSVAVKNQVNQSAIQATSANIAAPSNNNSYA